MHGSSRLVRGKAVKLLCMLGVAPMVSAQIAAVAAHRTLPLRGRLGQGAIPPSPTNVPFFTVFPWRSGQ
eukprot:5876627-Prymnesium_polylepis.1